MIIPLYNEEERIRSSLDVILRETAGWEDYEIIFVNDASQDSTPKVIRSFIENTEKQLGKTGKKRMAGGEFKLISLEKNLGKGGAVREGILAAQKEKILFCDADLSIPLSEASKLVGLLEKNKVVIGSRYLSSSKTLIQPSLFRRVVSRGGNFLVRFITDLNFADTQCGFKAFRAKEGKFLFQNLKNLRFSFDIEILSRAKLENYKIAEVGVLWKDLTGSTVLIEDMFRVFFDLFLIKIRTLSIFSLIGVLNTFVDFSIHNSLNFFFGIGSPKKQLIYQCISFLVANIGSFFLNSRFTFKAKGRYLKFFLVSICAFCTSSLSFFGLLYLLPENLSITSVNISKVLSALISMIINYFGYKYIVFNKHLDILEKRD